MSNNEATKPDIFLNRIKKMKKYPRIGSTYKHKKNNCAKCRCGETGRYKVDIQYNYMRGDDDVVWACEEHKKDIEYLTASRAEI